MQIISDREDEREVKRAHIQFMCVRWMKTNEEQKHLRTPVILDSHRKIEDTLLFVRRLRWRMRWGMMTRLDLQQSHQKMDAVERGQGRLLLSEFECSKSNIVR
jgi:hypothetical protein